MIPTSRPPGQNGPGGGAGRPGGGRMRGPTHAEDVGLFGPSSVTWRLHAEPVIGIAGLRALLLQAMHPVASTGVSWRRALGEDIWSRYARTAEFMGVLTFGSTTEALTVGARAQAEYAALAADPSPDREPSVDEIDLLTWVHCCLVDSAITVLDRAGVGIDEAEADRYVSEQLRTAALLGLDPGDVPTDLDSLRAYFRRLRPRLRVSAAARADAEDVVEPPPADRLAEGLPKWFSVAGLAFATLPSWARRSYGLPLLPGAAALQGTAITVALHAVRASLLGSAEAAAPALGRTPRLPSARERLAAPVSPEPQEDAEGTDGRNGVYGIERPDGSDDSLTD
ncbi:MAG TPA: oxygenase MpaB family protein [Actinomycetales bacterium]|nr:oxygenase MpaB family protein [Actinomycetales bacterium]